MNDVSSQALLEYLRSERKLIVAFLSKLVNVESPSGDVDKLREVRGVLATELEKLAFHTVPVRGEETGGHLYARPLAKPRGQDFQLLVGHYDTVWALGTLADRPVEVDGKLFRGPGVFDMKGGLVQIVFALKALASIHQQPSLLPVIFINGDEEVGSRNSSRYIHMLARRAQRALVIEPSLGADGALKTARKGVGRYTVTVHGKAAHAGLDPEGGASAILELSHVIQSLFALNDPDEGTTVNVGTIDGGMRPNVIAPLSQAVIDVRVPTAAAAARVDTAIRSLKPVNPNVRLRIEGFIGRPALEPTPRNQALWRRAQELGSGMGLQLTQARAGGGSDGNTTSLYTATLDGLGPVGDGAHAEHEFLDIDKTIERTALLALLLMEP